jgi:hypothetical protein
MNNFLYHKELQYRNYILHPYVDEYFTYNYKSFLIYPLIQETYYINKSENFLSISKVLKCYGHINMDFFINLNKIPPMSILHINIRYNGMQSNASFYRLEWISIYLYNLKCFPELVLKNIFILPNIFILENIHYEYVLEIIFNKSYLNDFYFKKKLKYITSILPYTDELINLIIEYLPDYLFIDICYKSCSRDIITDRIAGMLKCAFKIVYMRVLITSITNNITQIKLPKSFLHNNNILLTIFTPNYNLGSWEILPIFNKLVITNKENKYEISKYDLEITPLLNKRHFVKQLDKKINKYNFNITENITTSGKYDGIYLLNLDELVNKKLLLNDEYDDDDEDILIFDYYTNFNNNLAYIYMEISTK